MDDKVRESVVSGTYSTRGEIINVYRIEFRKPERKSPLGRYTVRTVVSSRVVASFFVINTTLPRLISSDARVSL